jgi:hypothetical protein
VRLGKSTSSSWTIETRDPDNHSIYIRDIESEEKAAVIYDKINILTRGINAMTNFDYTTEEL